MMRRAILLGLTVLLCFESGCLNGQSASDWKVWGGPDRNFQSPARGLANSWPTGGPRKLWSRALGEGFSPAAVEGDRVYTGYSTPGREVIVALDAATGKTVWEFAYDTAFAQGASDVGAGPYAMPQVIGDRIVTVGGTGKLHSIDKHSGKPVWSHDLYAEFGGSRMSYGYSCHAVAYDNLLILVIGGPRQAIVAFNQTDGRLVWGRHAYQNAHSSPLLINVDGQDQIVALMAAQVAAFDPKSGGLLWEHPHPTRFLAISTPVWGPDNVLVVSAAYEGGTRALHLTQRAGRTTVRELWHNPRVKVHFGSIIRIGDTIYAASGENGPAPITAVDVKSGGVLWHSGRELAKSQLLFADNKLIVLDEDGVLALATVSPSGLTVRSRVQLLDRVAWTPPSLAGHTLYVRDRRNLIALDLGVQAPSASFLRLDSNHEPSRQAENRHRQPPFFDVVSALPDAALFTAVAVLSMAFGIGRNTAMFPPWPDRKRRPRFKVRRMRRYQRSRQMKLARAGVMAAAILAVATVAWAQKPDFSGTWRLDPASPPGATGGGDGSALGNGPATVKQTADALTIERTIAGTNVTLTYKLDGSDSRNIMMGPSGQRADSLSIAKWDGPKLTIVTKQERDGALAEATQVWTIAGNTLTVETASGRGTRKRIYKK
jgi:outer membrane protein assembly factor BamB